MIIKSRTDNAAKGDRYASQTKDVSGGRALSCGAVDNRGQTTVSRCQDPSNRSSESESSRLHGRPDFPGVARLPSMVAICAWKLALPKA